MLPGLLTSFCWVKVDEFPWYLKDAKFVDENPDCACWRISYLLNLRKSVDEFPQCLCWRVSAMLMLTKFYHVCRRKYTHPNYHPFVSNQYFVFLGYPYNTKCISNLAIFITKTSLCSNKYIQVHCCSRQKRLKIKAKIMSVEYILHQSRSKRGIWTNWFLFVSKKQIKAS